MLPMTLIYLLAHHSPWYVFVVRKGQKCSALSRAYIPSNLWPTIKRRLLEEVAAIKMGQSDDFKSFMCAVIDEKSFDRITATLTNAKHDPAVTILTGGEGDKSRGYFIEPTILQTKDPLSDTMVREIFGPVLTIYVYDADKFDETIDLVDRTGPYALTGSIFAQDRYALDRATDALRNAAGNFYLNDKCTGAVVGQQVCHFISSSYTDVM
jgi:1-pyrroline-5-carboxylate dehydrogenase